MTYREQVLEYFAGEPADTAKAVCVIEEALGLPDKTLWPVLNKMHKDRTCPVYRAPATYEGTEYRGFACKAQPGKNSALESSDTERWSLANISASDVLATLDEFDRLGRAAFLDHYGYGEAARYFIVHQGRCYDSKAIVGVAHQVSHGRSLKAADFSGGDTTVVQLLKRLGFTVERLGKPDWTRDEVILACEIVVDNGWHSLRPDDARVTELSQLLQQLDVHPPGPRHPDFRNANGVARKTVDLVTNHPSYAGKATKGGKIDKVVIRDFLDKPSEMVATAQAIRGSILEGHLRRTLDRVLDLDLEANEGRILERRHIARERDPKLRREKIEAVRRKNGRVACEACGFDFGQIYGDHGEDYIECHHRVPLHVSGEITTKLADLVLLCSNCHRMIHRRSPWLTFEQLRELLAANNPGASR